MREIKMDLYDSHILLVSTSYCGSHWRARITKTCPASSSTLQDPQLLFSMNLWNNEFWSLLSSMSSSHQRPMTDRPNPARGRTGISKGSWCCHGSHHKYPPLKGLILDPSHPTTSTLPYLPSFMSVWGLVPDPRLPPPSPCILSNNYQGCYSNNKNEAWIHGIHSRQKVFFVYFTQQ